MTLLSGKDPYQLPFSFTEIGQIFFGIMIEIPERGKVKNRYKIQNISRRSMIRDSLKACVIMSFIVSEISHPRSKPDFSAQM